MARFDRFTKRAKQAIRDAHDEARQFDHPYVGSEHLLLGLIHGDGIAGDVLREHGIELQRARSAVEFITGRGTGTGLPELTATAKHAIGQSVEQARLLHHRSIATEHLLLALAHNDLGVVSGVLEMLGVQRLDLARAVLDKLGIDQAHQHTVTSTMLELQPDDHRMNISDPRSHRNPLVWLLSAGLGAAIGYIVRLQRERTAAQQRGDMYRDIAAELDRRQRDQQE